MPPIEQVRDMLLWTVLPALASAGLVMAAFSLIGGAKQGPAGSAVALIVGLILGIWLTQIGPSISRENPWPDWKAVQHVFTLSGVESSWDHLRWIILAGLAAERIARTVDITHGDGWTLRATASCVAAWVLIPETARDAMFWLTPAFALMVFIEWSVLARTAADPPDGGVAVCVSFVIGAAGVILLYAAIASFMQLAIVFAAALLGIGIVACLCRVDTSGAMPVVAIMLPTLMLIGKRTSDVEGLSWYVYALIAAAPLMLLCAWPLRNQPGFVRHPVRLALVLIPLIAAIVLAEIQAGPIDLTGGAHPAE